MNETMQKINTALLERFKNTSPRTFALTIDGRQISVKAYEGISYVMNPVETDTEKTRGMGVSKDPYGWQKLTLWIPETVKPDAPIIFRVRNAGWQNSALSQDRPFVQENTEHHTDDERDYVAQAFTEGYAMVECGTRGRLMVDVNGRYVGKAPACIVDAKAAIRFLRVIDGLIPCSAEKIVLTGTSGGGALSTILAASGNHPDFLPYLEEAGAADARDDVFGAFCYCPIIDLGHADLAYEWQYNETRKRQGDWSEETLKASDELKAEFGAYLKELNLKWENGEPLTEENLPEAIETLMKRELENQLKQGNELPKGGKEFTIIEENHFMGTRTERTFLNDWMDYDESGRVTAFDYLKFLDFVASVQRLKDAPSFDESGYTRIHGPERAMWDPGESNLYGDDTHEYCNYTPYSWEHADKQGPECGRISTGMSFESFLQTEAGQLVLQQIRMTSPFPYLADEKATCAPNWYVRHGMRDRDTSFAIETMLYAALRQKKEIRNLNFKFRYLLRHSGDYDVLEAYHWLKEIVK